MIFMKVFSTFPLTFFTSVSFDQTLRIHFTVYVSFYLSFNILKQKLTWYTVYDKIELWIVSKRLQKKFALKKHYGILDSATGLFCCGRLWYWNFCCGRLCHWTFLLWEILMLDFLASGQMNRQAICQLNWIWIICSKYTQKSQN